MKAINLLVLVLLFSCTLKRKDEKQTNPIDESISAKQEKYRQCFLESESYKGRFENVEGKVHVDFLITPEGKVKEAKIKKSDFKDPNLHACILDQIRQIKFEPIKNEIQVHQPINFVPVQS